MELISSLSEFLTQRRKGAEYAEYAEFFRLPAAVPGGWGLAPRSKNSVPLCLCVSVLNF